MLSENLKAARTAKGLTQEELAERLHVVRQTVSKWEKGLSVPDADLLLRLSEELGVSTGELLGTGIGSEKSVDTVAEQLARINAQLAERARFNRRLGKILLTVVLVVLCVILLFVIIQRVSAVDFGSFKVSANAVESEIPID